MESRIVVANLKMSMDTSKVSDYLKAINDKGLPKNVIMCPSNIYLPYFLNNSYSVGVQNVFFRSDGEFTGEISPLQVKSIGVNCALVGHPERRIYFNESDNIINKKIVECLKQNLNVILCIGESIEDKNMLRTDRILKRQIINGLADIKLEKMSKICIAYIPYWSLESNKTSSTYEIESTIKYIKDVAREELEFNNIKVLYGGNINKDNINDISKIEVLDGFVLEDSACEVNELLKIVEVVVNQ